MKFSVRVVDSQDGRVTLDLVRHYRDGSAESQMYGMVAGDSVALNTLEWRRTAGAPDIRKIVREELERYRLPRAWGRNMGPG